ncbi:hypothetical protein [Paenibacillus sp. FSL W8-0194]|uniref:hypothetical protein n=1 Tax=Paenibacillus sp. FSL W8-0194 TaxID=2921711 RepID=UPI0030D70EB5
MLLPIGVTIEERVPGEWRIYTPQNLITPAGTISRPYPTREEALKAAKEGIYD